MRYVKFNDNFKIRLWDVIARLERDSQVEMVVIIRSRSANYSDIPLYWGLLGICLAHTYLIFIPTLFADLTIYFGPLLAFALFWLIGNISFLQRIGLSRRRKQRTVEIMARALFQKAGIHHTQAKIGVLVFCSQLEKCTFVVADRGVELAIPVEEWRAFQDGVQTSFNAADPEHALLEELTKAQSLFNRYLPPVDNDINELPDNLDVLL